MTSPLVFASSSLFLRKSGVPDAKEGEEEGKKEKECRVNLLDTHGAFACTYVI
jgi:hypothetical protein